VHILHSAVGGITEGDVILAEASDAIVIGFNVVPEGQVRQLADSKGVDIRLYNIIYRITEDLRDAMSGMLAPDEVEESLGKLIVRDTFRVQGVGTIAGCYVTEGLIRRNCKVRLIRNNIVIKDNANLESLKHFKDDVKEVRNGYECGVKIAGYDDVKVDDQIHAYHIVEVKRTL
jgi:translation initiation factor IF-2